MEAGKRMLTRGLVTNRRRMVAGSEFRCGERPTANGEMLRFHAKYTWEKRTRPAENGCLKKGIEIRLMKIDNGCCWVPEVAKVLVRLNPRDLSQCRSYTRGCPGARGSLRP